jgi:hypothetical protein
MALCKDADTFPAFIYLTAMNAGMSPADCSQAYEIAQELSDPDFYQSNINPDYND